MHKPTSLTQRSYNLMRDTRKDIPASELGKIYGDGIIPILEQQYSQSREIEYAKAA